MRLTIDHRTSYRFSAPQARLVQLLRLTPQNSHDQTVASWRIDVDCDARLRERRDGFGNHVTMLYANGPLDGMAIAVTGEVLTTHSDGVLHGVAEVLPPAVFARATEATPPVPAVAEWAAGLGGQGLLDRLHRLNGALFDRFAVDPGRPDPGLDAAAAWERERLTPRDRTHLFCVAARSLGAPARYVTGYRKLGEEHRAGPHAWAEAHVDGIGWIGFDPCAGLSPEEDYVRVAAALDAGGAAPVAGSRLGDGEEELAVDVQVRGAA